MRVGFVGWTFAYTRIWVTRHWRPVHCENCTFTSTCLPDYAARHHTAVAERSATDPPGRAGHTTAGTLSAHIAAPAHTTHTLPPLLLKRTTTYVCRLYTRSPPRHYSCDTRTTTKRTHQYHFFLCVCVCVVSAPRNVVLAHACDTQGNGARANTFPGSFGF